MFLPFRQEYKGAPFVEGYHPECPNAYSLNKYRIGNGSMQKGKRGSYRCICACFVESDIIVLGTIYPKTGSDGVDNLTKEEYKSIAKEIMQALAGKSLFRLNCEKQVFEKP